MSGLLPFFALTGIALVGFILATIWVARTILRWTRVTCPERGVDADVAVRETASMRVTHRDVVRCSLLGTDAPVTCAKACLAHIERPAAG